MYLLKFLCLKVPLGLVVITLSIVVLGIPFLVCLSLKWMILWT